MKELDELRIGNFVNNRNGLGEQNFAEIIDVEIEDNEIKRFKLSHKIYPDGFVGYDDQIKGIIMQPEHIEALGFHRNPQSNIFEFYHHSIAYAPYTVLKKGRAVNFAASMRIFKPFTPVPQNANTIIDVKDFENYTVHIGFVHWFQNYCALNDIKLDFSPLKIFQSAY